jgi:murein DD-endopeptidase MepM/ murein hydrolase activator NlpD
MVASIIGFTILIFTLVLIGNTYYYDFLGLGNKLQSLEAENTLLKSRLVALNSQITSLQSSLDELDKQGNTLRLLVDLPTIDNETKQAGVGGELESGEDIVSIGSTMELLNATTNSVKRLISEVTLQKQSFEEINLKYQYNKELFSVLPALKPMEGYYSPEGFGMRMHPVLGIFKTHEGLDIVGDVSTPVYASGNGMIEFAGHSGGGYGIAIVINHGYGYQSLYAHLSQVLVKSGEQVKRGNLIGKSGKTGLVSGPHLHYEVMYKGVRQNPIDFFLDDVSAREYNKRTVAVK